MARREKIETSAWICISLTPPKHWEQLVMKLPLYTFDMLMQMSLPGTKLYAAVSQSYI